MNNQIVTEGKTLFTFSGIVQHNLGRGKQLGYPTANINVSTSTEEGLFIGTAEYNGNIYHSLIFIGPSVTFNETDKKAEIYILDFNSDIYDQELTVTVLKKLRDNEKFISVEALIKQMAQDEKDARIFFKELADSE